MSAAVEQRFDLPILTGRRVAPEVSVIVRTASPFSFRWDTMPPGPGRVSLGVASGSWVIFTVSPLVKGSETKALPLSAITIDATPMLSSASSW